MCSCCCCCCHVHGPATLSFSFFQDPASRNPGCRSRFPRSEVSGDAERPVVTVGGWGGARRPGRCGGEGDVVTLAGPLCPRCAVARTPRPAARAASSLSNNQQAMVYRHTQLGNIITWPRSTCTTRRRTAPAAALCPLSTIVASPSGLWKSSVHSGVLPGPPQIS